MDGFSGTEGVIVLGASNRPEALDPALLRPGRFDRRVTVNPPDLAGRAAILRVHTRGVPLAADVDLSAIAAQTPGMVGADLRNLVNEAALLSARRRRDRVYAADIADALEKLMLGAARRIVLSPQERERSAYHESGHALLGMLQPGADPVRKVSIVPRGRALGVTFQSADADRYAYEEPYLRGRIIGALGGRAAEQLVYGHVTTGAESDLEQATVIARQMVGRWGMSDAVGPVAILPPPGHGAAAAGGRAVAGQPAAGRRRGPPHRRGVLRGGARPAAHQPRPPGRAGAHAARARDPRRGGRLPGRRVPRRGVGRPGPRPGGRRRARRNGVTTA
jgi:cell division protease FtsH